MPCCSLSTTRTVQYAVKTKHPLCDSHVAVLQDLVWPIERLAGVRGEHESGGIVADNMAPTLKVC